MAVTLIINLIKLRGQEYRLNNLARIVENRKINMKLNVSKGEIATSLNTTIDILNDVGMQLSKVIGKTGVAVGNMATQFEQMDNSIAEGYRVQNIK